MFRCTSDGVVERMTSPPSPSNRNLTTDNWCINNSLSSNILITQKLSALGTRCKRKQNFFKMFLKILGLSLKTWLRKFSKILAMWRAKPATGQPRALLMNKSTRQLHVLAPECEERKITCLCHKCDKSVWSTLFLNLRVEVWKRLWVKSLYV